MPIAQSWSMFSGSPDPGNLVSVENRVGAEESQSFFRCLTDQEAIEGVAMMEWKSGNPRHVAKSNVELLDAVCLHFCRKKGRYGFGDLELPMLDLIAISHTLARLRKRLVEDCDWCRDGITRHAILPGGRPSFFRRRSR